MNLFISPAYAQGAAPGAPDFSFFIMIMLMAAIFYFLLIRPQQQRHKQHQDMVSNVRRGDIVVTSGGFVGRVTKAMEASQDIEVELNDQMRVRVERSTLLDVRAKRDQSKKSSDA